MKIEKTVQNAFLTDTPVEQAAFSGVFFDNCSICSTNLDPSQRIIIRGVTLQGITQRACGIQKAVLEDVTLNGLSSKGRIPLMLEHVVMRHVTISGPISMSLLSGLKPA